jgi:hypothetical protein
LIRSSLFCFWPKGELQFFIPGLLQFISGDIFMQGRHSSIVEITRFQLQQFTVSMKELAEWFGLELWRIVVEWRECLVTDT